MGGIGRRTIVEAKNGRPYSKSKSCRAPEVMHVILATQEAEIRRITVRNQPGQTVHETLS
jgi:hypothetical protein